MKFLLNIFLLSLLVSCGGDSDSSTASSNLTIFEKADGALASVNTSLQGGALADSIIATTISCDGAGQPTSSSAGAATYAGERVYCQLNDNSKSPDTLKGGYFLSSAILCAIEKQHSFTYPSSPLVTNGITIQENDSCFGTGGFDADGGPATSFQVSFRESSLSAQDYDYLIEIDLNATFSSSLVNMYLRDSNGVQAAKITQSNSITEVVINSGDGTVSFENRDYANDRHIRLRITGNYNLTTGAYSSITDAKLIHSEGTGNYVIFGYDGTNEFYDYHDDADGTSDGTGYPENCSGACTSLGTTFNSDFSNFSGNAISGYQNSTILDLSTFDMSF